MTEVKAWADRCNYTIEVDNHAATREVCNGVSALIYALEGSIFNNDKCLDHISELRPGYAKIMFFSASETGEWIFKTILIGLMQIERSHPEEIKITQNVFQRGEK